MTEESAVSGKSGQPSAAAQASGTTGDPRVDTAVRRLDDVDQRSSADAVEVYEDVHRTLADVLAEAASDGDPGHPGPGPSTGTPRATGAR